MPCRRYPKAWTAEEAIHFTTPIRRPYELLGSAEPSSAGTKIVPQKPGEG